MLPPLRTIVSDLKGDDQVQNAVRRAEAAMRLPEPVGRMPSSDTLLSTPFDPTIDVFTAPASIIVPTTATKPLKAIRAHIGPTRFIASPPMGLS